MRIKDPQTSHKVVRWVVDILYAVAFLLVGILAICLLQWGVGSEDQGFFNHYLTADYLFGTFLFPTGKNTPILLLNLILYLLAYGFLLLLTNCFWVATPIMLVVTAIYAVSERIKMQTRHEPILPSDMELAGRNTGKILSFIPSNETHAVGLVVVLLVVLVLVCVACGWYFGKGQPWGWITKTPIRIASQIVSAAVPFVLIASFVSAAGVSTSWAHDLAQAMGDNPIAWDASADAGINGVIYNFIRSSHTKVMDRPTGYSKEAMARINKRYSAQAAAINKTRARKLTNNTVILILSESFSDPTRVPGIHLNRYPMPYIRSLKTHTTSGFMVSQGYGGGTANLEFQALTGMSTALFDPSLSSPYMMLVPRMAWPESFNQLWNQNAGGSVAFHPYDGTMYLRQTNYKRFGFRHFWTLNGPEYIKYTKRIGTNPYVSDESTYDSVVSELRSDKSRRQQFIQVATMQNHMPYPPYYTNNPFVSTSSQGAPSSELGNINTYSDGMNYTDKATEKFLDELEKLKRPITVVWYGDHLPGIYPNEMAKPQNVLALHETDYFIWSNTASGAGPSHPDASSAYSSPNYFISQAADHLNAKISPWLAFLTHAHEQISALEPPLSTVAGTDWKNPQQGKPWYVDNTGKRISNLTRQQSQIISDYRLIQYDMTIGHQYLRSMGWTMLPR